jgi:hypothetical protein
MTRQLKGGCPACGNELEIAKYRCPKCHTEVSGRFKSCRFCRLEPELQNFITVFLVSRGNIKLVERELGISYPTVRKELKRVIAALGYAVESQGLSRTAKLTILDRLDKGEIDYASAMALLDGEMETEE